LAVNPAREESCRNAPVRQLGENTDLAAVFELDAGCHDSVLLEGFGMGD
jgi:hypothetical protein